MLLVKNKLKRLKKTIDDDDMLNFLKYSHLDISNDNNENNNKKSIEDKATQFPEMMNKSTQTKGRETSEKGVDTYDDLNKIIGEYILHGNNTNINKNDKMVQVNTQMLKGTDSKSPPSSSDDGEGFISRNARRGFRLAEVALNTAITTANLTMALSDAIVDLTSAPHQSEEEQQQEVISVHSSPPQTIISSSPPQTINSSPPSSIPQPTSPQSSPASSAKTTPRKKSK